MTATLRNAAIAVALCLLLRAGIVVHQPQPERISSVRAAAEADIGRIGELLGTEAAARARRWAKTVESLLAPSQHQASRGTVAIRDIEKDLFARLDRGLREMKKIFAVNLGLSAGRLAALAESLPLGALALAVGAANGWASRHARRHRLAPESAFAFRLGISGAWLAGLWFFAYIVFPLRIDPDLAAWGGWGMAAAATFCALAFFGGRQS